MKRMKKGEKIARIMDIVERKTAYYQGKIGWDRPEISVREISNGLGISKSTRLCRFLEDMVIAGYLDSRFYDNSQVGYNYGYTVYILPRKGI